jgi:hypothetical protein
VTDHSWTEDGVTWNTAPPAGDLIASLGAISDGDGYTNIEEYLNSL